VLSCGPPAGGTQDGGSLALASCLPGWWVDDGYPIACGSTGSLYCWPDTFTTPECAASDCQELSAIRYQADHSLVSATFTYSASLGQLSAQQGYVSTGTWNLTAQGWLYTDGNAQTALEEACTATQLTETTPGGSQPNDVLQRMAKNLANALDGAASSGNWQSVPVN